MSWLSITSSHSVNNSNAGDSPSIVMNKTHLKHKYLLNNKCSHEIQMKQIDYRDSVEQTVQAGAIVPIRFSPSDGSR